MRLSIITAAAFAALSVTTFTAPASAAPIGPGSGIAAPADTVTTVQMRMERRMMRHRMERRMMRHRMERRHMRHRMMRHRMMHRM